MKTYYSSQKIDSHYPNATVVAVGNFDGVHIGHQLILRTAKAQAARLNCAVTVFTFNPHPTLELRPQAPLKLLMTYEEKRNEIAKEGVDFCVEEPFNAEFAKTSANDFFYEILVNRLKAKAIVVGEDFSFGHKREGTLQALENFCAQAKIELHRVKPILIQASDGTLQPVSSSRIREALGKADLLDAQNLLGHEFFYRGEVIHGDKRGTSIGFPTANMKCEEKFPLQAGVYSTSVFWRNKVFASVTNIGTRPTFHDPKLSSEEIKLIPLKIETHLLDQDFDLYGEMLEVRFHRRLREEKKFGSIEDLKHQIKSDILLARASWIASV